ncbi:2-C-methyl-D-erythritol 4-phosphate cytidylyltransferase [Parabacteroides pacaensis]|uniref:2-C-methyl-D-erythritol 4-phosphate cytidylyltransferase n=1 Tax=Parabacteroides pacaensis TaxID=2086575 RepID=UPI000D0EB17B|nr:2-C-methyl-D-erythritol 4-phosphate cytidylyltransferase [Parabacteroides pacaensis]
MKKYVIIVAGGKGLRMGKELPKQFLLLKDKPILMHTINRFIAYDPDISVILVLPEAHQPYWKELCRKYQFSLSYQLANGGETRFHSVQNGLKLVTQDGWVAVHDGVRPFVSQETISACFTEAAVSGAAIPILPVIETLRERIGDSSRTVNRDDYCTVQTPQVFHAELLKEAYRQPYVPIFTDDASVVENLGYPVSLIEGNKENIKITTPFDLQIGEILCKNVGS